MHTLVRRTYISSWKRMLLITLILLGGLSAVYVWINRNGIFSTYTTADGRADLLQSGWDSMSGVSPQNDGLRVQYTNRPIVRQDGSPGMTIPSINLYGTHLYSRGDYTLTATVSDLRGSAIIRFYQSAPLMQDEFYTLPKNLELIITDTTVVLNSWESNRQKNPYTQKPLETITKSIASAPTHTVKLQRNNDRLVISIDDNQIYKSSYRNVFGDEVWFGLSAQQLGETWTLKKFELIGNISQTYPINTQTTAAEQPTAAHSNLQTLAKQQRSNFQIGTAVALAPTVSDVDYRSLVYGGTFGSITTENALKWQFIHPQPEVYGFTDADALVTIAQQHGLDIHGHTLIFGEANPAWVQELATTTTTDKNGVKKIMTDHITKTVEHFKGRIASWDVVNEPLSDDDGGVRLRDHIWFNAMGQSYIATAFQTARQADPTAKLYINDFGLEANGERWDAMLALVTKLKVSGVPIDGVGFQAHVYEEADKIDVSILRQHLQQLAKLGLSARISEMDVYSGDGLNVQAQQYRDVFAACFAEPNCTSWTTWGVTDRYNLYLNDNEHIVMGQDYLWDTNTRPTAAVTQIQQLLQR